MVPFYRVVVLANKNATRVDFHQRLGVLPPASFLQLSR